MRELHFRTALHGTRYREGARRGCKHGVRGGTDTELDQWRELRAIRFAVDYGEGVGVGAGDELGGGAGVEGVGESGGGVAADTFEFVSVKANCLADFGIFFEG